VYSTEHLKLGIVEPEETGVYKQRLGKRVPAAMNIHAKIEEMLNAVVLYEIFNMQLTIIQVIKLPL
jgi:hypothetical protein